MLHARRESAFHHWSDPPFVFVDLLTQGHAPGSAGLNYLCARLALLNHAWLSAIHAWLSTCRAVRLRHMRLSDLTLGTLCSVCPRMTSLDLDSCQKLTPAAAQAIAVACPGLEILSLRRTCGIGAGIGALSSLAALRILDLASAKDVRDGGVMRVVRGAAGRTLRTLNLTACHISAKSVRALATPGVSLERLTLSNLDDALCDDVLCGLARARFTPQLRSLDVARCPKLSDVGVCVLLSREWFYSIYQAMG